MSTGTTGRSWGPGWSAIMGGRRSPSPRPATCSSSAFDQAPLHVESLVLLVARAIRPRCAVARVVLDHQHPHTETLAPPRCAADENAVAYGTRPHPASEGGAAARQHGDRPRDRLAVPTVARQPGHRRRRPDTARHPRTPSSSASTPSSTACKPNSSPAARQPTTTRAGHPATTKHPGPRPPPRHSRGQDPAWEGRRGRGLGMVGSWPRIMPLSKASS
jgi:hypothetical protein